MYTYNNYFSYLSCHVNYCDVTNLHSTLLTSLINYWSANTLSLVFVALFMAARSQRLGLEYHSHLGAVG